MNALNTANAYKVQQIMTASPEQLTLMLYNGAIRFVHESVAALEQGDLPKAHESNMRAQDIVKELTCTLNMDFEISKNWAVLYEFIEYQLIQGNVKKDSKCLRDANEILTEMRDTWVQAMKAAKTQNAQQPQTYQTAASYR